MSEVVSQEVPDTFVAYVPKGVHKGIQVDLTDPAKEDEGKKAKMITKGIQVRRQSLQQQFCTCCGRGYTTNLVEVRPSDTNPHTCRCCSSRDSSGEPCWPYG